MKKYVLTGGHGKGKTSIILGLEMVGESVIREAASDYQHYQRILGVPFPSDQDDFEEKVLSLHLSRERKICRDLDRVFIDRGNLDHLVYSTLFKWHLPESLVQEALVTDYAGVFWVESFGSQWRENLNPQEQKESNKLENGLKDIYTSLGYSLVSVPPGDLKNRVQFILDYVS